MLMDLMGREEQEEPKRLAPPCYGCSYLCASPFSCTHPAGMSVRWDPIRQHTYRLPSVELVHKTGDLCSFYEPDSERGAEYSAMMRKRRDIQLKAHDKKVRRIDEVMDKINDDNVSIEEFLKDLEELSDEITKEDEGLDKNGEKT